MRLTPLVLAAAAGLALARAGREPRRRRPGIVRFTRVVADLDRAIAFYRDALAFRIISHGAGDPALAARLGLPGRTMHEAVLRLGGQEVALVRFDPPGAPYPADSGSSDLWFQHLAIVVSDMDAAYRTLSTHAPQPISTGGPETLPPRNGGVSAFKFRDPDGHPLELLFFPPGQGRATWHTFTGGPFLGIDHSALAASDTARSVRFYRRLGFHVAARSHNASPAQARLDAIPGADVRVTGLRVRGDDGPGLELLRYDPPGRTARPGSPAHQVTDWTTIGVAGLHGGPVVLQDPDGHIMVLVAAPPPHPAR